MGTYNAWGEIYREAQRNQALCGDGTNIRSRLSTFRSSEILGYAEIMVNIGSMAMVHNGHFAWHKVMRGCLIGDSNS